MQKNGVLTTEQLAVEEFYAENGVQRSLDSVGHTVRQLVMQNIALNTTARSFMEEGFMGGEEKHVGTPLEIALLKHIVREEFFDYQSVRDSTEIS